MSSLGNEETLSPVNVSVSKKRRNLPGRPDPDAEVIALSPRSLLTTNRFVCEICNKGFQRDQNLQLHRRGHNLPWKLKQKERHEYRKKVYICPELNCVHHDPARALGDLTGIKKHFSRKHGEKKWKCDKCSKKYAVQSDWKAHQKTCGTKEYRCDCGYLFSRKDSFITHRAYCDVHENSKDPPFNDEQAQKLAASPDEAANRNTIERDIPAPIDSTSSPVSPVVGDDPTCVEYPKGNSTERTPDPAMAESNIAALSSKWMQGGIGANNFGSSQRSELSLCLGTDLEPGPPNEVQVLGTRNSSLPVLRYPSLGGPNKLGLSQLASSESQSSGRHVPSVGAMDMLASLFSSSAQRQAGVDNSDSVGHAFSRTEHDHYSQPAGLSSSSHDFRNAYGHSASFHTSSAATSATALLQIAAELGAKASKPFMFQRYSMAGRDSNMSMTSPGTPRESPRAGFSSNGSLMSDQLKVRESEDYLKSTEFWGSTSSSRKVDVGYVTGGLSLHGNTLLQGPFPAKMHDNITSTFRDGHLKERGTSSTILRDPCFGVQVGCVQDEVAGLPRGDCEKRMVDFLGVNARGAVGRSSGDMVETSRKNLASMTSLTAEFRVPERFLSPNGSVG